MTPATGRFRRAESLLLGMALGLAVASCSSPPSGAAGTEAATTQPPAAVPETTVTLPEPPTTTTTLLPEPGSPGTPPQIESVPYADLPVDRDVLRAAFSAARTRVPRAIFAAVVMEGPTGLTYRLYEAGQGGDSSRFWPASSVKVLASVAALHRLESLGFDETAIVRFPDGVGARVDSLIWDAIVRSSNRSFDRLALLASPWYVANVFATSSGLDGVYLGSSLQDDGVFNVHDLRPLRIRTDPDADPVVVEQTRGPTRQNTVTLRQLTDVLRRILLADHIPEAERFALPESGLSLLRSAVCTSEPRFFARGARAVFGNDVVVCGKAGWNENLCIDAAWIQSPASTVWFLVAAVDERTNGCSPLSRYAEIALRALLEEIDG